jgi:peptidoglycan/xylan/chitin deacetylase (PgdA/CDA1 family)
MKNKFSFIAKTKVILASLLVSMFASNCSEVEKNTEPQNSVNSAKNMRVAAGNVYLCFDDGPTSNTTTLVNNLRSAGATATFFVWGNRISSNSAAFNAIKNAGFSIQNHS